MKKNILNFLKQNDYLITIGKFIIGILMFIIIDELHNNLSTCRRPNKTKARSCQKNNNGGKQTAQIFAPYVLA